MTVEKEFPKVDGDILYGSEASALNIIHDINAGENITAGNIVYIKKSDGKVYVSDTGTADDIRADGIALETVNSGNDVNIQKTGTYGITATEGEVYYLGASGAISTTVSAVEIGVATTTNNIFINIIQDDKQTLGTIKAWNKSFTGMPTNPLTAFWVECDGSSLSDAESPFDGQTLPDLNGTPNAFLRGNTTSGGTGGSTTHGHTVTLGTGQSGSGFADVHQQSGSPNVPASSNIPPYHDVVWIMKIK